MPFQVEVRFVVIPGFDYYVEHAVSVGPGTAWQTFPGEPHNSGVYLDRTIAPTRFYRVRLLPRGG